MPKQKRWAIKKKLEQADLAQEKAQNYLVEVGQEFELSHPEYYEAFVTIVSSIELVRQAIKRLSESI